MNDSIERCKAALVAHYGAKGKSTFPEDHPRVAKVLGIEENNRWLLATRRVVWAFRKTLSIGQ
jgi:hypothetical protein